MNLRKQIAKHNHNPSVGIPCMGKEIRTRVPDLPYSDSDMSVSNATVLPSITKVDPALLDSTGTLSYYIYPHMASAGEGYTPGCEPGR